MATTSLWHIEGRLKDLIDYVEDPEKTAEKTLELQDLYTLPMKSVRKKHSSKRKHKEGSVMHDEGQK